MSPRFFAVVRANGDSLFAKLINGYHTAQVFTNRSDAVSALDKYRKQRPLDKQHLEVVEVSWNG